MQLSFSMCQADFSCTFVGNHRNFHAHTTVLLKIAPHLRHNLKQNNKFG
jgi:hypothetical protein